MRLLRWCAIAVVLFVPLGCSSVSEPTPDPWVDLLKRVESAELRIWALSDSAAFLKRMIDIHGQTADCLELGYLADDILGGRLREMRVDLETTRGFLVRSDRDMEMHEFLTGITDITLDYLYKAQEIVNEALEYGGEKGCFPS